MQLSIFRIYFLIIGLAVFTNSYAQKEVKGIITDIGSGHPIRDVSIFSEDRQVKTQSDRSGNYSINVPSDCQSLHFKKKGYIPLKIKIDSTVIDLQMMPDTNSIMAMSLEELMNLKVTIASQRAQVQEEAPSVVSVISEEEIKMYGARDLVDVLRMIPGFELGMDVNGIVGLYFRGPWILGKMLLMIDGQEVNEMAFGGFNMFGTYPASMISRVEIIRGPGSAIYGRLAEVTTINIITKTGEKIDGCELQGGIGVLRNDFTYNGQISYGLKKNDVNISAHIGYSSQPISNKTYTDFYGNSNKLNKDNSERLWRHVVTKADIKNLKLRYVRTSFDMKGQDGFGTYIQPINGNNTASYNNFTEVGSISYDKRWGRFSLEPQITATRGNPITTVVLPIINDSLYQEFHRYQNNSVVFNRYKYQLVSNYIKDKWNLMIGLGYLDDRAFGYSIDGRPAFQTSSNPADTSFNASDNSKYMFVQFVYGLNGINITSGLRYENTSFGNAFAPRLGITFVKDKFNVKLLYGQAYRTPLIWQSYSRRWPPVEGVRVSPEITQTYEAEVGYKFNENTVVKVNSFYIQIKDRINFVPGIGSINTSKKLNSVGAEGELQVKYSTAGGYLNFSYSQPHNMDTSERSVVVNEQQNSFAFIGFPRVKINVGGYYNLKKFTVAPSLTYLGKRYSQHPSDPFDNSRYIENKPTVLANINFSVTNIYKTLSLSLSVHNIFDSDYSAIQAFFDDHAPMPINDRHVKLTMTARF